MDFIKLSECCTIIAGQSPNSKFYNKDGIGLPFFQGKTDFGDLYPEITTWCSEPIKIAEKDDILLSVRAPVGPTNLAPSKICIGRGLSAIRPDERFFVKYMLYFFKYFETQLQSKGTGTTFKAITQEIIKNIEIPYLPKDEQTRIVSRIEELFSELDAGVETLRKTQRLLEIYRQAVISDAYPDFSDENKRRLEEIADITGGITKGRNLTGKNVIYLPYLRVANVQNGFLDLSVMKTIALKAEEKEKYLLHQGDVLYTEGGDRDKLGRGTVWNDEISDCVHQNHIFRARIKNNIAIPKYVSYWSMSRFARNYFYDKGKQTVNLASINKTVLSNLEIPIPDISCQNEIVKRIEDRLSVCDNIENSIISSLQQADSLRQSILTQAFEGKL